MAHVSSEKVLKRVPYLRVSINASNTLQMYVAGRIVKCGAEGLRVLEIFSEPLTIQEAVRRLSATGNPADSFRLAATIMHLYKNGVLRDAGANLPSADLEKNVLESEAREDVCETPEDEGETQSDEVFFYCSLDDARLRALIPGGVENLRLFRDAGADELIINSRTFMETREELPKGFTDRVPHRDRFLQRYPILWVEDPATRVLSPYWLSTAQRELIEQLYKGTRRVREIPLELCQSLAHAEILVPKSYEESRREEWGERVEIMRRELDEREHTVLRGIINPLQLAALRRYTRALESRMYLEREETAIADERYSIHNEETARFVHQQLTALVNQITPERVMPSFTFLSVHLPGARLYKHTDRPQCAWNISLLVDAEPETDLANAWPFYLEIDGRTEDVRLEMGDAVLYRGEETPHWRDELPEGQKVTLIFCCFVPVTFEGFLT